MRSQIAMVKNLESMFGAYSSVEDAAPGFPKMMLIHGFTGAGKSTGTGLIGVKKNALFVRLTALMSAKPFMGAMCKEAGIEPVGTLSNQFEACVQIISKKRQPLIFDEIDYGIAQPRIIETIRDFADVADVPVILVGMEGVERKLVHRLQLARRITQWVKFKPLDTEDARRLVAAVCEVEIADDLVEKVHQKTNGSIGLMTPVLARIEAYAKQQGWSGINAKQWGDREMFLSKAPRVTGAPPVKPPAPGEGEDR
jgi:hypothetical protein